jgi:hypothetical protein
VYGHERFRWLDRENRQALTDDDFVGLKEAEARTAAEEEGYRVRITARDGEHFMVTMDYCTDRINFNIENNIVVCASIG